MITDQQISLLEVQAEIAVAIRILNEAKDKFPEDLWFSEHEKEMVRATNSLIGLRLKLRIRAGLPT